MTSFAPLDDWFALATGLFAGRAGLFLRVVAGCLAFVVVAALARRTLAPRARAWAQVATSLAFLAALTTPLLTAIVVAYGLALYWLVERMPPGLPRRAAIGAIVALQVVGPIWWLPHVPGYTGTVRELFAFATNATQLRVWSYAWDRGAAPDAPRPSLRDYALYMSFFPAFVGGPLVSYREFHEGRSAWYWTDTPDRRLGDAVRLEWRALLRVPVGLAAAFLALTLIPVAAPAGYRAAATGGALAAWRHALAVYFSVYLGFTAWSEAAIGCARAAGVVLPENFDHAHLSYGIADFWRRWNIRLGWWMRTYVYLPLGGGRRHVLRNLSAVFLTTAVYHHIGGLKLLGPALIAMPSFYVGWLGWAAINTLGTHVTRRWHRPERLRARDVAIIVGTFLLSSVALQTAFLPAGMGLGTLVAIYRRLVGLG